MKAQIIYTHIGQNGRLAPIFLSQTELRTRLVQLWTEGKLPSKGEVEKVLRESLKA